MKSKLEPARIPFRPFLLLTVLCIAGVACSKEASSSQIALSPNSAVDPLSGRSSGASSDALLLKPVVITDPARRNMPAYRLLVPDGWSVDGGVTAVPPGYNMIPYFSDITIEASDKRGVRFWGINEFGYADNVNLPPFAAYQGRPFFPPQPSLGAFWQEVFRMSPGPGITDLEIVSEEVMPEVTQLVRQQLAGLYQSTQQENAQLAMMGQQKTFDAHARQLVIRYKKDGVPVEATIFASVRHAFYRYQNGMVRAAMWNLDNMYAVFGPQGTDYLNDPALAAIVRSREVSQDWQTVIQEWYLMKNRQIVAEGRAKAAAAARASAVTATSQSDDVLDISFNGWKKRNSMNDAGHSASINGIHERTTYTNPSGNTVNLPSYYQNVYTDNQGNYLLHNDANYQINTDPTFNSRDWQRIEPAR